MSQITARYKAHMGGDWMVLDAARQSFNREIGPDAVLTAKDRSLIEFLAEGLTTAERFAVFDRMVSAASRDEAARLFDEIRSVETHMAPFCHPQAQFRICAPLAAARQLWKTHIGMTGGDAGGVGYPAWSETSLRYVDRAPEFFTPDEWRLRADSVKQGSGGVHPQSAEWGGGAANHMQRSADLYRAMLSDGIAPEMARLTLPAATMVSWTWTGSLLAWARVARLRLDPHAQVESRQAVEQIAPVMADLFPVSWAALVPMWESHVGA